MSLYPQAPSSVVMIRPHHFYPNEETRQDNSFQTKPAVDKQQIKALAFEQATRACPEISRSVAYGPPGGLAPWWSTPTASSYTHPLRMSAWP